MTERGQERNEDRKRLLKERWMKRRRKSGRSREGREKR